ncbi:MAG: NAD(P)/FAD-dependent oxidoreductase [Candidatus Aenigmarchaeota archaeon]|nr:NAD(P)/FAD-dependent oxidoreductase [Candidatus Aenigmarchaeota archaeon]
MYDIVVAGAGSAGCVAAYTAAKRGFKVCLIDAKPKEKIGNKICGNALAYHHLEKINLPIPEKVKTNEIEGIIIYSPSGHKWEVHTKRHKGIMLDRLAFGQYLLKTAIENGVELRDKSVINGPIIKNGFVRGVATISGKIYGDVVIDATGLKSPVRSNLPKNLGIETEIEDKDVNFAYREIRKVKNRLGNEKFCEIYLEPSKFPGGYVWIFPQGKRIVNVGLGVQKVKGYPHPKERLYSTMLKMELFNGSKAIEKGGMDVSTRRPLPSLVGNGILIVGEAGSFVDPVTGGGNGQAMVTGKLAANVACNALENGKKDRESLWTYNLALYKQEDGYGQKYTVLDAFRIFLQSITPKDIDYGMQHEIIKERDLITLTTQGELKLNIREGVERFFRGIGRLSLLKNLVYLKSVMEEIRNHCLNYPESPDGFDEWKKKIDAMFLELEKRFVPYSSK